MNLDQIKKDLEEFKKYREEYRLHKKSVFGPMPPLATDIITDKIEKHLEKLIIKNEEIWELRREETSINIGLINKLSKAEEVIRFYGDKENWKAPPYGYSLIECEEGQKAREYFEKGKHNV